MDNQIIISIGREYGSGGRYIAELIADELGIELIDKNLLEKIRDEKKIDTSSYENYDEKPAKRSISSKRGRFTNSVSDALAEIEWDYLKEKAEKGDSFVIVGRCAEYVLKDNPNLLAVFVEADEKDKLKRIVDEYGIEEYQADSVRKVTDQERRKYHNQYAEYKWGDSRGYHMCINSSRFGIPATAVIIAEAAMKMKWDV